MHNQPCLLYCHTREEKLEEEKERNLELRLRLEQTVRQKWDLFEGSEIANADKDSKLKRLQETNARLTEELNYLRANLGTHARARVGTDLAIASLGTIH